MNSSGDTSKNNKSHAPRLYHKKSRKGCQRCKARRVKCDEKQPVCSSCERHGVTCSYPTAASGTAVSSDTSPSPSHTSSTPKTKNATDTADGRDARFSQAFGKASTEILDIPESKSRRLLELRLLQNWIAVVSAASHVTLQNPAMNLTWTTDMPNLAMEHDNLLYTIFAYSATNMLMRDPGNLELIEARQNYIAFASREQRKEVMYLDSSKFDSVCFAALLMLSNEFAMLHERPIEPYELPVQWLQMGKGAGTVFGILLDCADQNEKPMVMKLVNGDPKVDESLFSKGNQLPFMALLEPNDRDLSEEPWDAETRVAYERTLSYIGSMLRGIESHEPVHALARRITTFTLRIPDRFVDLVREQKPRALVMLAYYFALCSKGEAIWWNGQTGKRELRGLQTIIPPAWQHLLQWPFAMAGLINS